MGVSAIVPQNTFLARLINNRNLYLLGIAIVLCGLPWSNVLMSIGQFVLMGNWLLEGNYREKLKRLWSNKAARLIICFFLIHLIGLFWTTDIAYALKDIRIKLVLLVIPFVMASSRPLTSLQLKILLQLFILSVFVVSILSYAKYFGFLGDAVADKRQLSIRISHIRYGLMIAFASICSVYIGYRRIKWKYFYFLLSIYFFISLIIFQFYTGLFIYYAIICAFLILKIIDHELSIFKKTFAGAILLLFILIPFLTFYNVYSSFHHVPEEFNYDQQALDAQTESGNGYTHHLELEYKENGYFVWRFINYNELEKEWNKRSEIAIDSLDRKSQPLKSTLIRYLTSMGVKKDSAGISKLTDKDIKAIENGIANIYYTENNKLKGRIHSTLYEIKNYRKYHIAEGFSVAMRMEYWKIAVGIVKENWLFGVGTGDIQQEFNQFYQSDQSILNNEEYWRRSHNQYLSTFVQLGIFGFLLLLAVLFYPLFQSGNRGNYLFLSFIFLISLSMLTEDTLETQAGASLFTLFYSLFLFNPKA